MTGVRGRRGSRRGRKRGRGEEKAPQQTHQHSDHTQNPTHQDYPFSPPFASRYQTSRPRGVLPQFSSLTSPLRSPLRSIKTHHSHSSSMEQSVRILNEPLRNTHTEIPELQHCTLQPVCEDPARPKNHLKDVQPSLLTGSASRSGPRSKHPLALEDLGLDLSSQFLPASSQDLHGNYQPSGKKYVLSHVEDAPEKSATDYVGRSSKCLTTSQSLNITEIAQRLREETDDNPEEVESALGPVHDRVNGHRVKIEMAPLLRAIFEKHGDITRGSEVKSNILSFFLERVCDIYQRLEQTRLHDVTRMDLNDMLNEVRYLESQKLNVGWLHERLDYVCQSKIIFENYLSVKEEEKESDTTIRSLENELQVYVQEISTMQQKFNAAEEKLVAEKAKADRIKKLALDIRARVYNLTKHSLAHGLL